jgi:threonine aldolase
VTRLSAAGYHAPAVDVVDLRSDTVTTPTPEMRRAMADAEVGDDVFGEDPTANALQERCAELFGKEAGLFVASGTMGNEVSIKALTSPGDEIVVEASSHILLHEVAAPAVVSGVLVRTIGSRNGVLDPEELASIIRAPTPFFSHTSLVCLENTHQTSGGRVVPVDATRAAAKVAHDRGCKVFLDGARIFNASVASGVPVRGLTADVDALSFCFSKGLGAPVGSMVLGSSEFIDRARKLRRMLGGGMRQIGVLCAAARVAVERMVDRLAEDHANARRLAEGVAEALPGSVDPGDVETNIVYVNLGEMSELAVSGAMWNDRVRVYPYGHGLLRAVTHKDVDTAGIDRAVAAFAKAVRA